MTQSLSSRLRTKRSEMMVSELECHRAQTLRSARLRRGHRRGHHVGSAGLRADLLPLLSRARKTSSSSRSPDAVQGSAPRSTARPPDEPPMHSLARRARASRSHPRTPTCFDDGPPSSSATPSVIKGVLGGIQLKTQWVIAEFLGARLGQPSDALAPTMLAAATQGVIQAAQTHWFFRGGDLAATISSGLEILENGIGTDPPTGLAAGHLARAASIAFSILNN